MKMPFKPPEQSLCPLCGKAVYAAEERLAGGKKWHKFCFKCVVCGKMLDSTTSAEHEGKIYCKGCYGKNFGPKGYGFGQGAGTLSSEAGEHGGISNRPSAGPGGPMGGPNACGRCGRTVYEMEKANGMSDPWHKSCCSCKICNKKLDASGLNRHQKEIYCKGCYAKNFGTSGYGFGMGAGCLSTGT
ncbi:Cysteine and glycine-rich protein 1 [Mactra antiquata]